MPDNQHKNRPRSDASEGQSGAKTALRFVLPGIILLVGWVAYSKLSVEKEKEKPPPGKPRALKTKVVELSLEDFPTVIKTDGIVRAHNEVTLTSQVAGRVIKINERFEDGAFFYEGTILVELDPVDYIAAVKAAEAALAQARAAHAQEKAKSEQALLNWKELDLGEEPNDLVLRKPQLREAEARVDSAQAQLEQAKRDEERTKIRAPFDGRVLIRSVGVSQSIAAGTALGTIFAIDYAEVRIPIAASEMRFLKLPEDPDDEPVAIELRDALEETNETVWKAEIVRTEGALDVNSLELFAIARIQDPFGRKTGLPPLRIGQPVLGLVPGEVLKDVFAVPRDAVRQLNRIYVVDKDELTISGRTVTPIWSDEDSVVIRDETIKDGMLLSTTQMAYVPDGAKVEIETEPESETEAAESGDAKKETETEKSS